MLIGTYRRTVDEKWRLPLPSELLAPASEGEPGLFYFAPADDHLILFPASTFERLSEQLMERSVMAHRRLRRQFFGNTYQKKRDKNGRIHIPEQLRGMSGLAAKEEAVIVGTGPYAEIRPAKLAPVEPAPEDRVNILDTLEALGEGA